MEQYKNINIDDALRFADILSKSTSSTESENHKTWAQEMISLLNEIYPNNDKLKYIAGSVYTNTGNLRGLEIINPKYKSIDLLEKIYNERYSLYDNYADVIIDGSGTLEEVAKRIEADFIEYLCD